MFERHAAQVDAWRDIHSGVDFINSRKQGEAEARALLRGAFGPQSRSRTGVLPEFGVGEGVGEGGGGVLTPEAFADLCRAVNRECIEGSVPKRVTCTRFGAGFGALLRLAPRAGALSPWLAALWALPVREKARGGEGREALLAEAFGLHAAYGLPGVGLFALSLVLYLKSGDDAPNRSANAVAAGVLANELANGLTNGLADELADEPDDADFFLPCTPALWRGLAFLKGQPVRDGAAPRTLADYRGFLRDAHAVRERFCLLPLEVDFVLARAEALRRSGR